MPWFPQQRPTFRILQLYLQVAEEKAFHLRISSVSLYSLRLQTEPLGTNLLRRPKDWTFWFCLEDSQAGAFRGRWSIMFEFHRNWIQQVEMQWCHVQQHKTVTSCFLLLKFKLHSRAYLWSYRCDEGRSSHCAKPEKRAPCELCAKRDAQGVNITPEGLISVASPSFLYEANRRSNPNETIVYVLIEASQWEHYAIDQSLKVIS